MSEHRTNFLALNPENRRHMVSWVLYMRTDSEYRGPVVDPSPVPIMEAIEEEVHAEQEQIAFEGKLEASWYKYVLRAY